MPDDDTYRAMLCDAARFAATRAWVAENPVKKHVRVGFVTAARIIIDLQDAGIIGPPEASGKRPVLVSYGRLAEFIRDTDGDDLVPILTKTVGGETIPIRPHLCEPHTSHPRDYLAFANWMGEMEQSHVQRRCAGCGLWAIWESQAEAGNPVARRRGWGA